MIRNQVKLPVRVAMQVVMQGIRIRFGRSLVTLTGVVCGIAFLMSILTGQALRSGVSEEEGLRRETRRMVNFLVAETGPLRDRTLAVIVKGALSLPETRFLRRMESEGATLRLHFLNQATLPAEVFRGPLPPTVGLDLLALEASAVVVLGDGRYRAPDWASVMAQARQMVVAVTRSEDLPAASGEASNVSFVSLTREIRPEELLRLEEEARQARFRNIWIVVISLLVTVIGISNAMLMSVTERFREIGTMKCLGALSAFVRTLFLLESAITGVGGGLIGGLVGLLFSYVAYGFTYGFGLTTSSLSSVASGLALDFLLSFLAGVILAVAAALYPASVASRMVPADALRSNV